MFSQTAQLQLNDLKQSYLIQDLIAQKVISVETVNQLSKEKLEILNSGAGQFLISHPSLLSTILFSLTESERETLNHAEVRMFINKAMDAGVTFKEAMWDSRKNRNSLSIKM